MTEPQTDPAKNRENLAAIQESVCSDDELDHRFVTPISNAGKVHVICEVLHLRPDEFDLMIDFPFQVWCVEDNPMRQVAGMYISNLRWEFLCEVRARAITGIPQVARQIAIAEFWYDNFNNVLRALRDGNQPPPVLH